MGSRSGSGSSSGSISGSGSSSGSSSSGSGSGVGVRSTGGAVTLRFRSVPIIWHMETTMQMMRVGIMDEKTYLFLVTLRLTTGASSKTSL